MKMRDSGNAHGRGSLSRREVLAAGAGGAAAVAVESALNRPALAAALGSENPLGPSVNGTISEVGSNLLTLSPYYVDLGKVPPGAETPEGPVARLTVAEDAALSRGGPATLDDFRPKEKVIAYIAWEDGRIICRGVEPLYVPVEGRVSTRSGARLSTDVGVVTLTDYTICVSNPTADLASLDAIPNGARFFATCRIDPDSGEFVAANIALL